MSATAAEIRQSLSGLDPVVLPASTDGKAMWPEQVRRRIHAASRRNTAAWEQVKDREAWEKFRDQRIAALRRSLGPRPDPPGRFEVHIASTLDGDGYVVQNICYCPRPGDPITANLYLPQPQPAAMPGAVICHSHHRPKTQNELQDIGITWARLGAAVIVPDQPGHGERGQQPFGGRQDYYFRYQLNMQLHVAGLSLMGWMTWDLSRAVDVLLDHVGVDPARVAMLGAVAGGGDPVAVTAAFDPRVTCVVPFNFGGPQPETQYPLPEGVDAFNFCGRAYFDATRNLPLSARDDFLPWVIVAAAAPRPLDYAHEFAWDRERDPVWRRLGEVYDLYGARDRLDAMNGWGRVTLRPPEASHCTNIGPAHRERLYPFLQRSIGLPTPQKESDTRYEPEQLVCLPPQLKSKLRARPMRLIARDHAAAGCERLDGDALRQRWAELLGGVEPAAVRVASLTSEARGRVTVSRAVLEVDEGLSVPLLLLVPATPAPGVVVTVAQQGKAALLEARADDVAALLAAGLAVCLPDLRGTGETAPGDDRSRSGKSTDLSLDELMLGTTALGGRLADLRTVLAWLRTREDVDARRLALWGDSLAPTNAADLVDPPQPGDRDERSGQAPPPQPAQAEPLGGLLALLGALFEADAGVVLSRRGLTNFATLLDTPYAHLPHDVIVPGVLQAGDVAGLVVALGDRRVLVEGAVNARNIEVTPLTGQPPSTWLIHAMNAAAE
ncbi:MAG: hypothetical protein BIFFINMI_03497 [Phycisphaerae bacterium]|nr:hypothetical protein [Phycisphaerae bacterium]